MGDRKGIFYLGVKVRRESETCVRCLHGLIVVVLVLFCGQQKPLPCHSLLFLGNTGKGDQKSSNKDRYGKRLISDGDLAIIESQLGYVPPNVLRVSARNEQGDPIVIKTYPLHGGAPRRQVKSTEGIEEESFIGTPFPTLYWLTCPEISRVVAEIERQGGVREVDRWLKSDTEASSQLYEAHRNYAKLRWECLTPDDRERLITNCQSSTSAQRIYSMLKESGIAGTNITVYDSSATEKQPSVKCLHAHYAHFLSHDSEDSGVLPNPVGRYIHRKILRSETL